MILKHPFLYPEEEHGKYLGPSKKIGSKMNMWILKHKGEIVSRTTFLTLTDSEVVSETEKTKRVSGGHTTNPPAESTYAGVVSQ